MDEIRDNGRNHHAEAARFAIAAVLALAALTLVAGWRVDLENLAKGDENTSRIEYSGTVPFTAYSVKDMMSLMAQQRAADPKCVFLLWLGNSQLHYINQYKEGDHLSPYWLRQVWHDRANVEPIGWSLPNADIQEYLVMSRYAAAQLPVRLLVAELVFDDLREDGLRSDFSEILGDGRAVELVRASKTGREIAQRFLESGESGDGGDALAGTLQQPLEHWLNRRLTASWRLWADRPQIEGNLLLGLYNFRNWVFGITPTTVRRMIPARYERNMAALRDMLDYCKQQGVPVLLYIAPIRQDRPIPYEVAAYARWKQEVDQLAKDRGARLVDLETLVPGNEWGSYTGEDVDFMHFQGRGHRRVAEALLPHISRMAAGGGR